jgi:hypothetical protein
MQRKYITWYESMLMDGMSEKVDIRKVPSSMVLNGVLSAIQLWRAKNKSRQA